MLKRSAFLLALLIGAAVVIAACGTPDKPQPGEIAQAAPVWPRPPAQARIRYERSITAAKDWGVAKSFFGRLADAFTGERDGAFIRPTGVVERDGLLFVADAGAQALFIFDAVKHRVVRVERLGADTLVSPVAVALGAESTVYLADSALRKVFAVGPEGRLLRVVADTGLARPAAVAYDEVRRRLYVADSMGHRVAVYSPDGTQLGTIGRNGRGDGEFNSPTHLALASDGRLFVTDALNFRIQIFDAAGVFQRKLGRHGDGAGDFAAPKGIGLDAAGNLYVVDALFNAVQIFDGDGALLLGFGEFGTGVGQFSIPGGLFIGRSNKIYVADAYNRRVQVFEHIATLTPESAR